MAVGFNVSQFAGAPVALDDRFMLDEALRQGEIDFDTWLTNHYQKTPELRPRGELVVKTTLNLLVHMRVRGAGGALDDVYERTSSGELRDALSPVLNVPSMIIEPLGK